MCRKYPPRARRGHERPAHELLRLAVSGLLRTEPGPGLGPRARAVGPAGVRPGRGRLPADRRPGDVGVPRLAGGVFRPLLRAAEMATVARAPPAADLLPVGRGAGALLHETAAEIRLGVARR